MRMEPREVGEDSQTDSLNGFGSASPPPFPKAVAVFIVNGLLMPPPYRPPTPPRMAPSLFHWHGFLHIARRSLIGWLHFFFSPAAYALLAPHPHPYIHSADDKATVNRRLVLFVLAVTAALKHVETIRHWNVDKIPNPTFC